MKEGRVRYRWVSILFRTSLRVYHLISCVFFSQITSYSSNVPATLTPQQHIEIVLRKLNNSMNLRSEHPHNYVLKVCGREEYLFGDYPLIQFLYIQEMLAVDGVPQVMTVSIDKLRLSCEYELGNLLL